MKPRRRPSGDSDATAHRVRLLLLYAAHLLAGESIRLSLGVSGSTKPGGVGESCFAGKDLVVQALEEAEGGQFER